MSPFHHGVGFDLARHLATLPCPAEKRASIQGMSSRPSGTATPLTAEWTASPMRNTFTVLSSPAASAVASRREL